MNQYQNRASTTSSRFVPYDTHIVRDLHSLDDIQPAQPRYASLGSKPYYQEYEPQERRHIEIPQERRYIESPQPSNL